MSGSTNSELQAYNPAPYNPRTITEAAIKGLQHSIEDHGDLSGLVFNKRTGNVIAGHQRRKVIVELPQKKIEWSKPYETPRGKERSGWLLLDDGTRFACREVDWEEAKERRANVAANNPHISGDWKEDELSALLEELQAVDPVGFEGDRLDALLEELAPSEIEVTPPEDFPEVGEDIQTDYKCPMCEYEWSGKPR